ncbi:MAG: EscU/YscU/HrcU family type III secretion system export apparatus switch protein [Planctomycetota bacterium]
MSDATDRTLPATPRRREAARRAGMGAPADLPAWAASAGTALVLAPAWARSTIPAAAESFRETCAAALHVGGGDMPWPLAPAIVLPTLGLVAASLAAGLAVRFLCDGVRWQPGLAAPDLRRIDPLAGLKRIMSWGTVTSALVSAAGLALLVGAAGWAARPLVALQATPATPDEIGGLALAGWRAALALVVAAAAVAAGQWLLARLRFERRIRMTPQEFAEERKDLEADPRVKLLLRERRQAVAAGSGKA